MKVQPDEYDLEVLGRSDTEETHNLEDNSDSIGCPTFPMWQILGFDSEDAARRALISNGKQGDVCRAGQR